MKKTTYTCDICGALIRKEERRASGRLFWDSTYPPSLVEGINCLYKWEDVCRECARAIVQAVRLSVDSVILERKPK